MDSPLIHVHFHKIRTGRSYHPNTLGCMKANQRTIQCASQIRVEVATGHWAGIKGHFPVCSRDQKGSTLHALALLCNTLAMVCTVCTVKCAVCSVHCVQMCCVHCVHFPVCAVCLAICSSSCIVSGLPGWGSKAAG